MGRLTFGVTKKLKIAWVGTKNFDWNATIDILITFFLDFPISIIMSLYLNLHEAPKKI